MTRKTAELYVVYLEQEMEGRAAPYRNEWRESSMDGGARVRIPADGKLTELRDWYGKTARYWTCFGLSASPKAGAPCVALSKPVDRSLMSGDAFGLNFEVGSGPSEAEGFGLWSLIDNGEFTRIYHLMIAALPAVWNVKKAAKP